MCQHEGESVSLKHTNFVGVATYHLWVWSSVRTK